MAIFFGTNLYPPEVPLPSLKVKGSVSYEEAQKRIPAGNYRHFKGGYYHVNFIARDAETQRPLVIYTSAETGQIWVRDAEDWLSEVSVKRFERIDGEEAQP